MTLAYVPLYPFDALDDGEAIIHSLGVQAGFDQVKRALGRDGITVDDVVMHHEIGRTVAELLLECADGASAQLIAVGSARHSRVDRWMLGSVSTDLVRDGRHSVLVVPPTPKRV